LFYFLNHAVESSIIPLELIFEHRNYLPSFFLFSPLIAILIDILKEYSFENKIIKTALTTLAGFLILGLGFGTYIRNQSWSTELSLWEDAMRKAPAKARPLNNLGICLAWGESPSPQKTEIALQLFEKALLLEQPRKYLEADTLGNIGNIYFEREKFQKAADYYRRAIAVDPNFIKARYDLVKPLVLIYC
jgi:tetratricopeptide (TPR) repeat protein